MDIEITDPKQETSPAPKKGIDPSIHEILPGLFIGNLWCTYPTSRELREQHQIKSILSVNEEGTHLWDVDSFTIVFTRDRHLKIFCLDSHFQDILVHMHQACDFIEDSMTHGGVLVHCVHGRSRSAAFVVAFLMRIQKRSLEEVLVDVMAKRRRVKVSANFQAQLEIWGQLEYDVWKDEVKKVPKEPYAALVNEKGLVGEVPKRPADLADFCALGCYEDKYTCKHKERWASKFKSDENPDAKSLLGNTTS